MKLRAVNNIEYLATKLGVSCYKLFKDTGLPRGTVYHLKAHPETLPGKVFINTVLESYPDHGLEPSDFFRFEIVD